MKVADLLPVLIGDYVLVDVNTGSCLDHVKASDYDVVSVEPGMLNDYIINVEVEKT